MSVRPFEYLSSAPTGRIFVKLDVGNFNNCGENGDLVKIGHKYVSSHEDLGSFHTADNDTYSSTVQRPTMLRGTHFFVTVVTHPICTQLTATHVA